MHDDRVVALPLGLFDAVGIEHAVLGRRLRGAELVPLLHVRQVADLQLLTGTAVGQPGLVTGLVRATGVPGAGKTLVGLTVALPRTTTRAMSGSGFGRSASSSTTRSAIDNSSVCVTPKTPSIVNGSVVVLLPGLPVIVPLPFGVPVEVEFLFEVA